MGVSPMHLKHGRDGHATRMPTYEYKCDACGVEFERFQSIMAAPIKRCPECGKAKVRRLISTGGGMIFKGSGFYITDYRDKAYTDKAKSESANSDTGDKGDKKSSDDSKSESKPDSKSESKSDSKATTDPKPAAKSESPPKSDSKPAKGEPKPRKK